MIIFISNLVALWIVGILLSTGFFLALRGRGANHSFALGIIWSVLFSWAFLSWMLAKLIQLRSAANFGPLKMQKNEPIK